MTIEEMKERKKEFGLTNEMLSQMSGVPVSTIQKVFGNTTSAPRYTTIMALESVLNPRKADMVADTSYVYGSEAYQAPQSHVSRKELDLSGGGHTLKDYYSLPDDVRVELIDGYFFRMEAPGTRHQTISGQIWKQLDDYIEENGGNCQAMYAPVDVQLDKDDWNMLQPDILIVCDPDKIEEKKVFGAPDFVAEILSPSTKMKDTTLKRFKYWQAGVREYWIIDPDKLTVDVYDLVRKPDSKKHYTFRDEVPVIIYQGKCKIDFVKISKRLHLGAYQQKLEQ